MNKIMAPLLVLSLFGSNSCILKKEISHLVKPGKQQSLVQEVHSSAEENPVKMVVKEGERKRIREEIRDAAKRKYGCYLFGNILDRLENNLKKDLRYNKKGFVFNFGVPENFLEENMDFYMIINKENLELKVYQQKEKKDDLLLKTEVALGMHKSGRYSTKKGDYFLKRIVHEPYWYPNPDWSDQEKPSPPGKNNPFGLWMSELSKDDSAGNHNWGIKGDSGMRIHSTNHPESIGKYASRGCIRMRPYVAEELFNGLLHYSEHQSAKSNSRGTIYPLKKPIPVKIFSF